MPDYFKTCAIRYLHASFIIRGTPKKNPGQNSRDFICPLSVELLSDGMKIHTNLSLPILFTANLGLIQQVEKSEFSFQKS
jgi:hypothetical protein